MTPKEIVELFREKGRTLGCVESLTGGLFAKSITDVPGSSHIFKGGMITYTNETKARLLSIPYSDIDEHGVVSQEIAQMMANRGQKLMVCDYCISFTGNAGPDALEGKPVGKVYIAVSAYNQVIVTNYDLTGTREEIREQCITIGCILLKELLLQFN